MKSTLIYRTKNISRRGAKRKEEENEREKKRKNLSTFRRGIAHYRDVFYYRFELIDFNYIPRYIIALRWIHHVYCHSKKSTMITHYAIAIINSNMFSIRSILTQNTIYNANKCKNCHKNSYSTSYCRMLSRTRR